MILNVIAALLGFALTLVALWWIWPPLALLVAGLSLIAFGFLREVPDGTAG